MGEKLNELAEHREGPQGDLFDPDKAFHQIRREASDTERPAASAETAHDTEIGPAEASELPTPDLDPEDSRFESVDDPRIPEGKMFFKIGEVAKILDVKPYVLRYWETEFAWLKPSKTSTRQRLYRRQDVALLLTIRRLRYDERHTIAASRELIKEYRGEKGRRGRKKARDSSGAAPQQVVLEAVPFDTSELSAALAEMRRSVHSLLELVDDRPKG